MLQELLPYHGSMPVGARFIATLVAHPVSPTMAAGVSILRLKQRGCCVKNPLSSSTEVKERVELYYTAASLWAFTVATGWTVPYFLIPP
jgi:hypothetical protein